MPDMWEASTVHRQLLRTMWRACERYSKGSFQNVTDIQKVVLALWILGCVCIVMDYIGQKIELGGAYTIWIAFVWTAISSLLFVLLPYCE